MNYLLLSAAGIVILIVPIIIVLRTRDHIED
ncbi:hypothetical protein SAMN05421771_3522 [Granulicella pectinivorans]|uniref:Uncharacterized protein n=1 Tax=Granulicella pectinivorans TaxID=474950 RepID=A0A1I6MSC0_9BACT|nr:hypothetical protein SAMN05421771_3522 [Granulicella pectinivorans]